MPVTYLNEFKPCYALRIPNKKELKKPNKRQARKAILKRAGKQASKKRKRKIG